MNHELLTRVVNTPGISGFEEAVQAVVTTDLKTTCDEVRTDRLGNVIGLKKATACKGKDRPLRVVLAAHCDEIGAMVKHIEPEGYIRFQPVGGLCTQALTSQMVIIHGREEVKGVVVPDMAAKEIVPPGDLIIDLGMPVEKVKELVDVGDPITLAQELVKLNDKVWMGRNFDDRIGTFCLLEAVRRVGPTAVDVYAVSTVQEEVGVRGMPVAAYAIEPDLGLALDGSCTKGVHVKPHQYTVDMGLGAGIYLMDGLTIGDKRLIKLLLDLAKKNGIAVQKQIGGGTDASALQRTKAGALATTVGAPVRYMHTTVQLCHEDDIEATVELLRVFLENAHLLEAAAR
jgi:putative aminopeptidase FrvX